MTTLTDMRAHARKDGDAYLYAAPSFHDTVERCAAFIAGGDTLAASSNVSMRQRMVERARGDNWSFGAHKSLETWRAAMLAGDPDARARVESFRTAIAPDVASPLSARRKQSRGAQGDEVCPHAILAGRLDRAWTFRKRAVGRAPAPVCILVPMTQNAGASPESFNWRGAAALALAGPLQRAGYRVSIVAADCVRGSYSSRTAPHTTFVAHRLSGGAYLDVARVAAVMSAAHLRFVTFATIVAAPWACEGGMGQSVSDDAQYLDLSLRAGVIRAGEEVLSIPTTLCNESSAREWVSSVSARYSRRAA